MTDKQTLTDRIADTNPTLPAGCELVLVTNPQTRTESVALIKAVPWVDERGHLHWARNVSDETDGWGEAQTIPDQHQGRVIEPIIWADSDDWQVILDAIDEITESAVSEYTREIEAGMQQRMAEVLAEIATGDYGSIEVEDEYVPENYCATVADGCLWITSATPVDMDEVETAAISRELPAEVVAAIEAYLADDDE